jgi:hypothetical protein
VASGSEDLQRLREAIGSLVSGDVAEIVTQAREDARARVRVMLAEVMAEEMLEQVRRELGATREPEGGSAPGLGYYVYGVTVAAGASAPEIPGVDSAHPVTALPAGDLVALVSRVPLAEFDEERLREHLGDIVWVETIARRHEAVLESAAARTSVIPMRLCTIYREAAGVRAMLERESAAMHDALVLLEGRSEWGVKVFSVPEVPAPPTDPPGPEAESGAAYLEQRRQDHRRREAIDEERAAACEAIHGRLSGLAVRARVIPLQRPEVSGHQGEMALNGVYLIDDDVVPEFHDAVAALQSEFGARGVELQSTGPWPAYNFVPDAIGVSP